MRPAKYRRTAQLLAVVIHARKVRALERYYAQREFFKKEQVIAALQTFTRGRTWGR